MTPAGRHARRVAVSGGFAPALSALLAAVSPDRPPAGPSGHVVLPTSAVWPIDVRSTFDLPGGRVVAGRLHGAPGDPDERGGWPDGLVWLRLGLSEALRATCVAHLGSRRTGDAYILHQQLVRGVLADAAATQLEVRAVLEGISDGTPDPAGLGLLNVQITTADREQVRLLGASGYLASGPGTVAYASELLAEVHTTAGASA